VRHRARLALFSAGALALAVLLGWGVLGLPRFGHTHDTVGDVITAAVTGERHVSETVGAITFDYRGIDTMGEELILFVAVAAVAIVLRDEHEEPLDEGAGRTSLQTSETIRFIGLALLPCVVLLGLYIVSHGHVSPGGGFQGGVILASGALLLFLAGDFRTFHRTVSEPVGDPAEAVGMGGYLVIGLAGLAFGAAFLDNVLPFGSSGDIASGGVIPLLNLTVGLEVGAGIVLITIEYLETIVRVRQREVVP